MWPALAAGELRGPISWSGWPGRGCGAWTGLKGWRGLRSATEGAPGARSGISLGARTGHCLLGSFKKTQQNQCLAFPVAGASEPWLVTPVLGRRWRERSRGVWSLAVGLWPREALGGHGQRQTSVTHCSPQCRQAKICCSIDDLVIP